MFKIGTALVLIFIASVAITAAGAVLTLFAQVFA